MVRKQIRSQGSTKLWTAPQLHSLQSKMTTYFISGVQCFVLCFRAFKPWFVPISIKPTHQYKTVCVLVSIVCMLQLDFSHSLRTYSYIITYMCDLFLSVCLFAFVSWAFTCGLPPRGCRLALHWPWSDHQTADQTHSALLWSSYYKTRHTQTQNTHMQHTYNNIQTPSHTHRKDHKMAD